MAKKTTKKRTNTKPAPKAPVVASEPASEPLALDSVTAPEVTPEAPETNNALGDEILGPIEGAVVTEHTLKDVLMVYNSVVPSRRRWIQNRNELRNRWKELFKLLEQASGRTGDKADLYDYNWHMLADKGGFDGLTSKPAEDVVFIGGENYATVSDSAKDAKIATLEAEILRLSGIIEDITLDNQGKDDVTDETTPVEEAGKTLETETTTVSE